MCGYCATCYASGGYTGDRSLLPPKFTAFFSINIVVIIIIIRFVDSFDGQVICTRVKVD